MRLTAFALSLLMVLCTLGCGGGGGGGSTPAPTPPPPPPPPPEPTDPLGDVGTRAEEQARLYKAVGEDVIAPAYGELRDTAASLDEAIESYCGAPTADQDAIKEAWRAAMLAWQRIQHLTVGPIEADNRRYRLQFFPDSNEAVERGVDTALAGTEPLTETVISGRNVGVQGLPALEYLVFEIGGLDDPTDGPRRCELAEAVAANVATIASQVAAPWAEGGAYIDDFVNIDGDFMESDDVLVAILEAMANQAEYIADRKLKPALDASDAQSLESPYAKHSAENITANVEGLEALFEHEDDDVYRLRDYLERTHEADSITEQLDTQLTAASDALAGFDGTLEDIVGGQAAGDPDGVYEALQDVADLVVDAAVEAGVELGFNNLDGD